LKIETKKGISLNRAAIETKALNYFKRVKGEKTIKCTKKQKVADADPSLGRSMQIPGDTDKSLCVKFEVFTAVTMKNGVSCDVTPCGSCRN
jgi:hypothetical protein